MESKPFFIWTMQRCGGTNFAEKLNPGGFHHEPFQVCRDFGCITKSFKENPDNETYLYASIEDKIKFKQCIKHCVEVGFPKEMNDFLAKWSCSKNYTQIFLYRQQSWKRLISLHFAKRTGAWGPRKASGINFNQYSTKKLRLSRIDIEKLINHEIQSFSHLQKALRATISYGGSPLVVSFEDLYESKADNKELFLSKVNTNRENNIDQSFKLSVNSEKFQGSGDQNTKHLYELIPGIDQLRSSAPMHPSSSDISKNIQD